MVISDRLASRASQPVPNLVAEVGKFRPLCHKGFPNLPSLPNLLSRVHVPACACVWAHRHPRARMQAREQIKKRLGRLGRLGRSRQDKASSFPTSSGGWEQVGKLAIFSRESTWIA